MNTLALVALLLTPLVSEATIFGASPLACEDMTPQHVYENTEDRIPPQDDADLPYSISFEDSDGDGIYEVTIDGGDRQGFMIQARADGSTDPLGVWSGFGNDEKSMSCPEDSGMDNGATHTNPFDKATTELLWDPSGADLTDVRFVATVAQDHDHYWLNVESDGL